MPAIWCSYHNKLAGEELYRRWIISIRYRHLIGFIGQITVIRAATGRQPVVLTYGVLKEADYT